MLLATDLDGTFLAGSPEARHTVYQLIARNPGIKLAYVVAVSNRCCRCCSILPCRTPITSFAMWARRS